MKNIYLLLLISILFATGCSDYLNPKPTINVYYIQDENRTNHPIVKTKGKSITISTAKKDKTVASNKIKLYFIYRDRCPACVQLKKVMRRDDIEAILDKDFEVIRVNIRDKYALPKVWMRPMKSPTVYFLDKNQEELIPSIHNVTAWRMKEKLLEAIEARDRKRQ